VNSQVTAEFENMPLPRLLSGLGTAYGLCLSETDGIYHFSLSRPDSATAYWVGQTRTVLLNYLPVQEALLLLPDVTLPYVRAVEEGNMLVVSGPPAMVQRIAQDVASLDKPGYHCRLQSWVLTTQDSKVSLKQVLGDFAQGTTRVGFDSTGNLTVAAGTQHARETLADLQALTTSSGLKAQRLPSIWCKNGQTASLFVGQTIYFWRFVRRTNDAVLDKTLAGTQLVFSPRTDGQNITASMSLQSDMPGAGYAAPKYGPLVMRRSARTIMRLQSGELMLIGGLLQGDTARVNDDPQALPWPLDAVASGRLHTQQRGEVAILIRMEAALTPPVSNQPIDAPINPS
jgi:type II secretory pathway component GspD/PulD (secretin)